MRKIIIDNGLKSIVTLDEGLYFGRGVFETILCLHKPIFLKEHIERLNRGILKFNLGEELDLNNIEKIIKDMKVENCGIKILVTEENIIFKKREIPYKKEDYVKGFSLKIHNTIRNSTSLLSYIKSINYIENLMINVEVKKEGFNEAVLLNEKGFVTEGTTANIFLIKDEVLYTPSISCGLLDGIIRGFVIKKFNVVEKEISKEELLLADEVFITNSLIGIMKVNRIDNKNFSLGEITELVIKDYKKTINEKGGV